MLNFLSSKGQWFNHNLFSEGELQGSRCEGNEIRGRYCTITDKNKEFAPYFGGGYNPLTSLAVPLPRAVQLFSLFFLW